MKLPSFVFLLLMDLSVGGDNSFKSFVNDTLSTFIWLPQQSYATDEAPEICLTLTWILCHEENIDPNALAEHIATLYK